MFVRSTMLFLPFSLGFLMLLASQTASAADMDNAVFPDTFKVNLSKAKPECLSCLTDLVDDVCDGASGRRLDECVCNGAGASKLRDGCLSVCPYGTYVEWWIGCIEEYPQLCDDAPKRTVNQWMNVIASEVYLGYCAGKDGKDSELLASATAEAAICTAESDSDLSSFNRDCDETVSLDDSDVVLKSTGTVYSVGLVAGVVVVFTAGWLY